MKQSKNLGIRKSCPTCRKTVIVDGEFEGKGKFKILCPHCFKEGKRTLVEIEINKKTTMTTKIFLVILIMFISFGYILWQTAHNILMTELPQEQGGQ